MTLPNHPLLQDSLAGSIHQSDIDFIDDEGAESAMFDDEEVERTNFERHAASCLQCGEMCSPGAQLCFHCFH